ncbi:hypothetical protein NEIG_00759 [Nematocida sp. ERTm5]|nr:hypothetical protein NEIG_00759 [Nematocida sp. ERTm5]
MERELFYACLASNLEESSIVLGEYIFKKYDSPEAFLLLLTALMAFSKYEAAKWLITRRREYFDYTEVQIIYIEVMKRLGELSEIEQFTISETKIGLVPPVDITPISIHSLSHYYQGLIHRNPEKARECFISALKIDERNFEVLLHCVINSKEIVYAHTPELKELFKNITETTSTFSLFSRTFHSPFTCAVLSRRLFNQRQVSELFQISQYMSALYKSNYLTYITIGMYYILVGKYSDSKRALFKALQLNNSYGVGWILLGYTQGFLCEGNNAITCYEKAEILLENSFMASLGIALEYHRMKSYKKAEKKYLEVNKGFGIEVCLNPYLSLLIMEKRYAEVLELIKGRECAGERALIKSMCYIFLNDLDMAESALLGVNISYDNKVQSKYYLLQGYIYHTKKKYCDAIEMYQKAILKSTGGTLVNDLLELAIKNSLEESDKKLVVQYKEDLFDFLDLKSDLPLTL